MVLMNLKTHKTIFLNIGAVIQCVFFLEKRGMLKIEHHNESHLYDKMFSMDCRECVREFLF